MHLVGYLHRCTKMIHGHTDIKLCVGTEDEALNISGCSHGFCGERVTVFYLIDAVAEVRTHYLSKQYPDNTWTKCMRRYFLLSRIAQVNS